jgi:Tfp pilus assembly major pilin PilA
MIKKFKWIGLMTAVLIALSLQSCMSVKQYQKNRLNDSEMELTARKSQKFEQSFQLYREGGAGANGGKNGGGCGCN